MKAAIIIMGDQLVYESNLLSDNPNAPIIMIEADNILRSLPYHKHKLILVLAAMRQFRDYLVNDLGRKVWYVEYKQNTEFNKQLVSKIKEKNIKQIIYLRPSNRPAQKNLKSIALNLNIKEKIYPNELFITPNAKFQEWYENQTSPLMDNFYRWQRKRLGILMDDGKPVCGQWNFDKDNRRPLPDTGLTIPSLPSPKKTKITNQVIELVEKHFSNNPGRAEDFWLPTGRSEALSWLDNFIENRLENFGDYEDAMESGQSFLFHSVLSPMINLGLISPAEAVKKAVDSYKSKKAPINSVEGFVRQIIGWREYMHGLYWFGDIDIDNNYFELEKELEDWWYSEEWQNQDLPKPVAHALKSTFKYGYNHHIERLMILGNWFLLNEYNPKSVYKWFSSMYVDAYEWVMLPNVIGMSQNADGGKVATKPYISGGNYLQKMGSFWPSMKDAKNSRYNSLYWNFLDKHRNKLNDNPRMSLVLAQAKKHAD